MKLFQYAILHHPLPTKEQTERGETPRSVVVKDITSILVRDEREALMTAAREIPSEYLDKLDRVEIALRPF